MGFAVKEFYQTYLTPTRRFNSPCSYFAARHAIVVAAWKM